MIRHVLLDADGVLQRVDPGWAERARPHLGERAPLLLEAFWGLEREALVGRADAVDLLAEALRRTEIAADAESLYPTIWLRIEVLAHTRDLVTRLRATGRGVHLGTNQTRRRAAYMRRSLGYDDLFDRSFYSCDLGAAKPDPAFFERAVAALGAAPAEVAFVDDSPGNVAAAAEVGLAAVAWRAADGLPTLEARLAAVGVPLETAPAGSD